MQDVVAKGKQARSVQTASHFILVRGAHICIHVTGAHARVSSRILAGGALRRIQYGQTRSYSEIAKFLGAPRGVQADFRLTHEKFGALCNLSRQFDDICLHASVCLAFTSVLMHQRGVSETST